ncbi:hypothetical protein DFJ73DRAFT_860848 [Zopfochytrium polystomum]|nr:hypothetical protein DFJ73DRAFT_860848 [Zopfochytrium polystomum]
MTSTWCVLLFPLTVCEHRFAEADSLSPLKGLGTVFLQWHKTHRAFQTGRENCCSSAHSSNPFQVCTFACQSAVLCATLVSPVSPL